MKSSKRWKIAQWFELRWWKNYLATKDTAEYLYWKKKYWNGLLEKCAKHLSWKEGDAVLDTCCGPAGIFIVLEKYRCVAIDPLLDEYEKNLPLFNRKNYPVVEFVNQPLEDFSSPGKFSVVFSLNAINHVQNLQMCLVNCCDAITPGGQLVLTIDAHNFSFFKFLFRLIPGDILHPVQDDLNGYTNLFESRGLKLKLSERLKKEFFFSHYLLVFDKSQ